VNEDLLAIRIRWEREVAGLTLADVSARCGINPPALSRLENGHTPNPTLDTLRRYAAALGKRLVLTGEDAPDMRARGRMAGARW
jgi:transcriptional regulator with XRE-family HTH domain